MTRSVWILLLCLLSGVSIGLAGTGTYLFVGTYTDGKPDKGIYVYSFNSRTGKLKQVATGDNLVNPSFLAISPNGQFLYACTDTRLPGHGSISAFRIDSIQGKITFINKQSSGGQNPVYVSVHNNNRYVVTGNYAEGNVSVLMTTTDGALLPASQVIPFTDSSLIKSRQEKSHIHATVFSPGYDYLFLPDLGGDKIRAFHFNTAVSAPLISADSLTISMIPGSGPRHVVFHPNNAFAYCVEELSGMVSAYRYQSGRLDTIQRIFSYSKTLDTYSGADIHISPDGRFLYTTNRGENTIAIFSIDQSDGTLMLLGHQPTLGDVPRNFVIDPSGRFILVANVVTNNIVVFRRNAKTGLLKKTKVEVAVPGPACLQMRTYRR